MKKNLRQFEGDLSSMRLEYSLPGKEVASVFNNNVLPTSCPKKVLISSLITPCPIINFGELKPFATQIWVLTVRETGTVCHYIEDAASDGRDGNVHL